MNENVKERASCSHSVRSGELCISGGSPAVYEAFIGKILWDMEGNELTKPTIHVLCSERSIELVDRTKKI